MSLSSFSLPRDVEETKSNKSTLQVSKSEPNLQLTNEALESNNFSKSDDENSHIDQTKEQNKYGPLVEKVVESSYEQNLLREKDTTDHTSLKDDNIKDKDVIHEKSKNIPLETETVKETLNEDENENIKTLEDNQDNTTVLQKDEKLVENSCNEEVCLQIIYSCL